MSNWENNEEIKLFREYLRIPTAHPDPDYNPCIDFLKKQADDLNLPYEILYPGGPSKPVFILKWIGSEPTLPSIMLNSHMDVVPVFEEHWNYPPFAAEMDEQGRIYARGTQDMKSVGMQYLAALRILKKTNFIPRRTIFVTFVPDEENRSHLGMSEFIKTETFQIMNVGFAMDEGAPSNSDKFAVFYGERILWQFTFVIKGNTGHGSLLIKNTAGEKLSFILKKMLTIRNDQVKLLKKLPHPLYNLGEVTTINLTKINGGAQTNVLPSKIEMTFDCRISPKVDVDKFEKQLQQICKDAGDVELVFDEKDAFVSPTGINKRNLFWMALKKSLAKGKIVTVPVIAPGNTDARHLRNLGIPVIGFSPINNTPALLHGHNEYLSADVYLKGIEIYTRIIPAITNV